MIAQDANAIDSPILQLAAEYSDYLEKDPDANPHTCRAYIREVNTFAEIVAEKRPGATARKIEAENVVAVRTLCPSASFATFQIAPTHGARGTWNAV